MDIQMPIKEAGHAYKMYASRLEKLGITKVEDFLYHYPFRYEDYSLISKIAQVQAGEIVTIQGSVVDIKNEFTKNFKRVQKATIADASGTIEVIWFNQPFLLRVIHIGDTLSLSGKIGWFFHKLVMESPEYEILIENNKPIHTGRLVPIYPETRGISSKWLRRQIYNLLKESKQNMFEHLPDSVLKNNLLLGYYESIEQIHFPKNKECIEKAKKRLAFDELFLLQINGIKRRREWQEKLLGNKFIFDIYAKNIEDFWESLPFSLTNSQKKALHDIFKDLAAKKPMNRLLEGDVGSGKTVVATIAMYLAYLNGFQSVLMAPTEILAQQHYATITSLLSSLGVTVDLVTGSTKFQMSNPNKRERKKEKLAIDIFIGTHALLSKNINFDKLGLVVIDEQQRFGVEQRAFIRKKGKNPHLLTMTATPIPRTVALTLYGDLDVSYLDEMPKGRKKIKTWLVPSEKRANAYEWIHKQIKETGSQIFIICPFIEESESMQTVKAATKEYERLQKQIFSDLHIGLLHGKMKSKEKDKVLHDFKEKNYEILVATPVVEVGIDISNATIMLIEASERFGLSQLHQLRGRVGRGEKQSYCLLFTEATNTNTLKRLKSMETMYIGAELAELDLKLRGPGDVYGILQHGVRQLKIANFYDFLLIEKTKKEAENIFPIIKNYPLLEKKIEATIIKTTSPD